MKIVAGVLGALALAPFVSAQTHQVAAPETAVVRAVGVYEWTGDMAKPTASRLIPVTLFINDRFEDAAVYLARPVPFALETGNLYQMQKAGTLVGALNLLFARHFVAAETSGSAYDDGWFGYGKFVPPSAEKKSTLKPAKTLAKINAVDDPDDSKPHFSSRSAAPGSGGSAEPKPGSSPANDSPSDDTERPTMRRHGSSPDKTDQTGTTSTPDPSPDDPDRPTLRRRAAADSGKPKDDQPSVTPSKNSLNDDPGRPLLHRGKPEGALTDAEIPRLIGLPGEKDLHQMVAVSDAKDRPTHDYSRAWDDEKEHQAILGKMQTAARAQLAAYEAANTIASATPPPAPTTHRATTANKLHRSVAKATPPPPRAPEALLEEQLAGYTLSYGGAPTYVYYAHTDGLGPTLRYVTLVAQVNTQGEPEIVIKSVTDAAHLDRTPRMKLVDAVDAEASNRASLLFELRAQSSRQFALYRVIGARADQTFLTGSTQ